MNAIIYIRWSSAEQTKGSSLERQRDDCRRHASAKGWNVIGEIIDDGVSAFRGKNASADGKLGRFVAEVEAGAHPSGVVLLVEKLDRLSREEARKVFVWMLRVVEAGVVICTVDGDRRYDKKNIDMAAIIEIVVKAQLANEESSKKSDRLSAAWRSKRGKVAAGEQLVMTRRAPAWLRVVGKPARFELIEDRAEIVRRIYEETVAGFGKHSIARRLNEDGVATFGRAKGWHASYVQKILASQAVVGEMQLGRRPRGGTRSAVGEAISDYYPAVVDADLHARAKIATGSRSRRSAGKGRKLVNVFGGVAKCEACGARMTFRAKGAKARANGYIVNEDYLVCDGYQRGIGCTQKHHFNYEAWQQAILEAILTDAVGDRHFGHENDVRILEIKAAESTQRREAAIGKREAAMHLYLETKRSEVKAAWAQLAINTDECDAEIKDLRRQILDARGKVSAEEHEKRIAELYEQMYDADDDVRFKARSSVKDAVHELVSRIDFGEGPAVKVTKIDDTWVAIEPEDCLGKSQFSYNFSDGFFG